MAPRRITARAVAKVNQRAVEAFLASTGPERTLAGVAIGIKDDAVAAAPDETGYYRRRMLAKRYRSWWRVENEDPFAHLVEWGSVNNKAYAPVRTAIRQANARFVPGPKA